ncbi:uncharacterized protein SRS1_14404 [Sporisorium reilianum f. sp. reilianum]|uniref:MaoC-like domain-containing protein n=1 Tax=Sporisorium reilianum f. sp. reilianum TaxID=72559 RepID=A0A2N8UF95_9BASI|nr:uncharacterized protein SRS1_14404 [Sporisorium reilianum f. sp. reilianum]
MLTSNITRLLPTDTSRGLTQLGLGLVLSSSAYQLSHFHFRSLCRYFFTSPPRGSTAWQLDFAPSDVSWADRTFLLVCGMVWKAVRALVVGSGLKVRKAQETVVLPRLDLTCPVEVEDGHVEMYARAVAQGGQEGVEMGGEVGAMERQFLLAAMTNQLMLLLVVHPKLPVSPLGGVNVRNRYEFHSLSSNSPTLTAHAYVGGKDDPARVVKRGNEFDIHIDILDAQQLILRQTITILTPCKTHLAPTTTSAPPPTATKQYASIGSIHMTRSSPALWCRVCGDYNPIHVSSTLAKLFGFRGKIAHGNHVVGKMLHLYASQNGGGAVGKSRWWIEMQFKRPMVLPIALDAQVGRGEGVESQQWQRVTGGDGTEEKVYVLGGIGRL